MRITTAALAASLLCAAPAPSQATETGIPIADPYAGNKCFKFWLNVGGIYENYAISLDGLPEKAQADLITFAIQKNKSVTLVFLDDLDPPYAGSFPKLTRCYNAKGDSTYWEYIVGVQVNN